MAVGWMWGRAACDLGVAREGVKALDRYRAQVVASRRGMVAGIAPRSRRMVEPRLCRSKTLGDLVLEIIACRPANLEVEWPSQWGWAMFPGARMGLGQGRGVGQSERLVAESPL